MRTSGSARWAPLSGAFLVIPVTFMPVWLLAVSIALWRRDIADAPAGTA